MLGSCNSVLLERRGLGLPTGSLGAFGQLQALRHRLARASSVRTSKSGSSCRISGVRSQPELQLLHQSQLS